MVDVMEMKIVEMMEYASNMQMGELKDELEMARTSNDPLAVLTIEIVKNEINKRKGKRHLTLEAARKYVERMQAAE